MYSPSDFRKGLKIEFKGEPYIIIDFLHVKPGKGGAFIRTKLKNMITSRVLDETFRPSDKITRPDLEEKSMQYLYKDTDGYCFMDNDTYEQVVLSEDLISDSKNFLQENINLAVLYFNSQPIGLELPTTVGLAVVQTEPGVKGDTASGGSKPATLETGLVVQVPFFINEGDRLKIDTRTGEYMERIKE
ncbi:MAG: elongation factor P [Deltaproteobacteria bacterium]|nr:elongation factor P [Deltaproteobacteria bacterium]MBW2085542.1 elongation factor P [Deltaproteobacteria bacterium]